MESKFPPPIRNRVDGYEVSSRLRGSHSQPIDLEPKGSVYVPKNMDRGSRDWLARGIAMLALTLPLAVAVEKLVNHDAPPAIENSIPQSADDQDEGRNDTTVKAKWTNLDNTWSASAPMTVAGVRFQLFITSSDVSFNFSEIDRLQVAGKTLDLGEHLLTPIFVKSFERCKAMVVLGTASQEGNPVLEARRARDRSEYVQYQIWSTGRLTCPMYTLNLGKARESVHVTDSSQTAHQRRLIVATILDADPQTLGSEHLLRAALHSALGRVKGLPVDPIRDYSSFTLERKH